MVDDRGEDDGDDHGAYASQASERQRTALGKKGVGRTQRHIPVKAALVTAAATPSAPSAPRICSAPPGAVENILDHQRAREKDSATKDLVAKGVRANRFCRELQDDHIKTLLDTMEFFAFDAGETIVSQGVAGSHFFVIHEGVVEVSVDGRTTNKLDRGHAFGAIALLYDCPRTATVVALEATGIWGVDGAIFRRVLKEHGQQRYSENRKFLERVALFEGLSAGQMAAVSELALFNESFEAGARVVSEGEIPRAMYIVKSGELSVMSAGSIDDNGKFSGGERTARLCSGDVFGEQALRALHGEKRSTTVVADSACELVCIGIPQLKEVLGEDLAGCLERSFMLSTLRRLPIISQLSLAQLVRLVDVMEAGTYEAGADIPPGLRLAVVIDGELTGRDRDGKTVQLARGTWHEDDCLADMDDSSAAEGSRAGPCRQGLTQLKAGDGGARLGTLTKEALARALRGLGIDDISTARAGSDDEDYVRKALLARKVPVFRSLSAEQVDNLVSHLILQKYAEDTFIFRQGELGSTFFVVAKGELRVLVNERLVRMLSKGACFGERALLLNEPRSATVIVVSGSAELWCIDREAFEQVVTQSMREEMIKRIQMQDASITLGSLKHIRVIGAGSFGSVRLVEHRKSRMRYALKRVRKHKGEIPEEVERECSLLAEMDHPFVICMVKTFATASSVYILMELVTGGQLFDRQGKRMGVLSRKHAQFYIGSLVLILESLHERGIVYRDLKPENVMLDDKGYLKLVDFGIAKKLDESHPRTYTMTGTLYYLAPELIRGRGYGLEVDMWALGVVGYELVAGRLPFGDDLEDENSILHSILDDPLVFPNRYNDVCGEHLIKGLLCKTPEKRLGAGIDGWDAVKAAKFFKAGLSGINLFDKIVGREMEPPYVPQGETYCDEGELEEEYGVTLSDADQFGTEPDVEEPPQSAAPSAAPASAADAGAPANSPSSRTKNEETALMYLATQRVKPQLPSEVSFGVKPPSKPREGPPAPRPVPGGASEAPSPSKTASKLREQVDAARGDDAEEEAWRALPSVATWFARSPQEFQT